MMSNVISPQNVYALIVGIEKYDDPAEWDNLDGSANAALAFTIWLYDQKVPPANINLCLSLLNTERDLKLPGGIVRKQATFSRVSEILNTIACTEGEMFFFFWAGHGVIADEDRRLFFADATARNPLNLNLDRELEALRTDSYVGFPQQFCFVDACAETIEKIRSTNIPNNDIIAKDSNKKVFCKQYAYFASKDGERSRHDIIRKIGYFSQVLMEELKERTLSLNPEELWIALEKRFEQLHETDPKIIQTPNYSWINRNAKPKVLDYRHIPQAYQSYLSPLPPLNSQLLRVLNFQKELCQQNNIPFFTPSLLLTLLEISGGVAEHSLESVQIGLTMRLREKLKSYVLTVLKGDTSLTFSKFRWEERADVRKAQHLALQEGEDTVTEKYLLLGILETKSNTQQALKGFLGGNDFHRLVQTIQNGPKEASTPGISDFFREVQHE